MLRRNITSRSVVRWYLGVALTLTALSGILHWVVTPPTGLVRTFYADVGFAGEPLFQDRTTEVSLAFLDEDPTLPRRLFSVHWHGFWYLPHAQTVDLYAGADDRVDVLVDRRLVLRRNPVVGMHTTGETIRLAAGAHEIIVRYEQDRGGTGLNIQQAGEGGDPGPFLPTQLFPQRPDTQDYLLATGTSLVVRSTVVLWLVLAIGVLLVVTAWAAVRVSPYVARPGRRALHSWRTVQGVFERVTGRTITQTCHIVLAGRAGGGAAALRRRLSRTSVLRCAKHNRTRTCRDGGCRVLRAAERPRRDRVRPREAQCGRKWRRTRSGAHHAVGRVADADHEAVRGG